MQPTWGRCRCLKSSRRGLFGAVWPLSCSRYLVCGLCLLVDLSLWPHSLGLVGFWRHAKIVASTSSLSSSLSTPFIFPCGRDVVLRR